jgi:hypothetical protein
MSDIACTAEIALEIFKDQERTFVAIDLWNRDYTDAEVSELVDCLLAHPNRVTGVVFSFNRLTDVTGVKLARYVAASSTIQYLSLHNNQFGEPTYLALAAALRINTSLENLYVYRNQEVNEKHIDLAFIEALRVNPVRPIGSMWQLYAYSNLWDYLRLQAVDGKPSHPSLQLLLCAQLDRFIFLN